MKKIMYAIQAKQAEEWLNSNLQMHDIVTVGSVAYREAILPALQETPVDILVYRESLKGSKDTFDLMREIRTNFPKVRIVFIANEQPWTSKLLCQLTFLGIYDILNSNAPGMAEIQDFIIHPRDYGYASKFFQTNCMNEMIPELPAEQAESQPPARSKGLSGLFRRLTSPAAEAPAPAQPKQAVSEEAAPKIDLETMRGAMLEEARRTAQAELPQLVQTQVSLATADLQSSLEQRDSTITSLTNELKEKTDAEATLKQQLEEAVQLRRGLEKRFQDFRQGTETSIHHYQMQLVSLQTTKAPEWYQEQTEKWLSERADYQTKLAEKDNEIRDLSQKVEHLDGERERLEQMVEDRTQQIEALQLSIPRDVADVVDDSQEGNPAFVFQDEETESEIPETSSRGDGQVVVFMGTKHGVGNTTVALNTAVALANRGYKTCLIELNRQFPMINEYFEFSNIVRGLDIAIQAIKQNNTRFASQCLIKPHGIHTTNKSLLKVYKRLPGSLHFLLYGNEFLHRCKDGSAPYITERERDDLLYFLTVQEKYRYVVIDLQPDDMKTIHTFLSGGCQIHKLILTMTQDPHSITTAGYLIPTFARGKNSALLRNMGFIVNQFSALNKMPLKKISDFLHVDANRLDRISLDSKGYMDASFSIVPYFLSKGKYVSEYTELCAHLSR